MSVPGYYDINLSRDITLLSKLDCAFRQDFLNHRVIGELLYFPSSAIDAFVTQTNGVWYQHLSLEEKRLIPAWVAFCPFVVPESEISYEGECAQIGIKYRESAMSFDLRLEAGMRHNFFGPNYTQKR